MTDIYQILGVSERRRENRRRRTIREGGMTEILAVLLLHPWNVDDTDPGVWRRCIERGRVEGRVDLIHLSFELAVQSLERLGIAILVARASTSLIGPRAFRQS